MTTIAPALPRLSTLLRLGRISNLPTVWTNVIAGCVIAGEAKADQLALLLPAMTAFYVGGMYLNDFFDRAIDARDRPTRPIPAGDITAMAVLTIGLVLMAAGIALMMPFGGIATACGILLAATILLYDVWHKGNAFSPIVMGLCRALVYVGVGVALSDTLTQGIVVGALALASHVASITYAAKQEDLNRIGHLWPLGLLAAPLLLAVATTLSMVLVASWLVLLAADFSAIVLLARRPTSGAVPLAVSRLIAAICLVDALSIAGAGGSLALVALCAAGYPLTRLFQKFIPGT